MRVRMKHELIFLCQIFRNSRIQLPILTLNTMFVDMESGSTRWAKVCWIKELINFHVKL